VENVSWKDIQEFIRRLNLSEKTDKYRLPTEAEWEYACRAETTGAMANQNPEDLSRGYAPVHENMGWYSGNSDGTTHPVAILEPNAWNIYDMHGSVWEWCQDRYAEDIAGSDNVTDPVGPYSGWGRIIRGGSWAFAAVCSRSANRKFVTENIAVPNIGFRLVRTK